nr:MAG TPA: hypothetical protein [Bacteriophage sp.]
MITYVNTVLVGTGAGVCTKKPDAPTDKNTPSTDAGKFIMMNMDGVEASDLYTVDANTKKFRIGFVTSKNTAFRTKDGDVTYVPVIKWSNPIKRADITSKIKQTHFDNSEDVVTLDFSKVDSAIITEFAKGERRIIVRLTFKDMPTRYRKWTESYEYVTKPGDTAATIAEAIKKQINVQYKRARVIADLKKGEKDGENAKSMVELKAMAYDDDNMNDSLNWADKVRFSVNAYYTDPTAPAFASKNKYSITGLEIKKTPGKWCTTDAKLVRDREAQAMGYQGILNRGEGTWPVIKPDMITDITKKYDGITIMFENHYHAADDQIRRTKECVEIYGVTGSEDLKAIETAIGGIKDESIA